MNEWTTTTLHRGPCTIVIRRPVLTSAERAKREQATRGALESVLSDYVGKKEKRECKARNR